MVFRKYKGERQTRHRPISQDGRSHNNWAVFEVSGSKKQRLAVRGLIVLDSEGLEKPNQMQCMALNWILV